MYIKKHTAIYRIKRLTAVALFGALSYVLAAYIKIPVGFLSLEIKDSLIILCALLFGPVSGLAVAVLVPFFEFISVSTTGVYGLIMNLLSSVVFSMTVSIIYRYIKSFLGAVIGLVSGVCAVTAVMMLANLFITPFYMGSTTEAVAAMIPTVLLPFNLVKAILNAAIVLLLYKPLSVLLKKNGFVPSNLAHTDGASASGRKSSLATTVAVTAVAATLITASLLVVFFVLK